MRKVIQPAKPTKIQVAQLSQRDRAAGWVSFGQVEDWNCETIYGHYRFIFNHCDVIGQQSSRIL